MNFFQSKKHVPDSYQEAKRGLSLWGEALAAEKRAENAFEILRDTLREASSEKAKKSGKQSFQKVVSKTSLNALFHEDNDTHHRRDHSRVFQLEFAAIQAALASSTMDLDKEVSIHLNLKNVNLRDRLGHFLSKLPDAQSESILNDGTLGRLLPLLLSPKTRLSSAFTDNEMLESMKLTWQDFRNAQKDLRFNRDSYKASRAVAIVVVTLEACSNPKVKRTLSLTKNTAIFTEALPYIRLIRANIFQWLKEDKSRFYDVAQREDLKKSPPQTIPSIKV